MDKLKELVMSKAQLENIVKQPSSSSSKTPSSFTDEKNKKEDAKKFSAMAEPEAEGAIASGENRYQRRTFDLQHALLDAEQDWHHRYADKVTEPKDQFRYGSGGMFRYRKKKSNKRRRL